MALTEEQKRRIEEEEKFRTQIRGSFSRNLAHKTNRNRVAAALLAIFLGGLGIHKFYLHKPFQGLLRLLFFWTLIPEVIGFIEGIIYLLTSDKSFELKYS